jgi:hypothetical protein
MRRILLLQLCLTPWVAPLPGATLERLSLDDVIQKSTDIVRARVVGSSANFRGSVIYTHWKVEVLERWKGAGQSTLEVRIPGGTANGFRQDVAGAPTLVQGRDYLLLLWTAKSGATYLTGLSQGLFELSKDAADQWMASRAAISETMLDRKTWQPVKDESIQMRYSEITAHVTATVGGKANE